MKVNKDMCITETEKLLYGIYEMLKDIQKELKRRAKDVKSTGRTAKAK